MPMPSGASVEAEDHPAPAAVSSPSASDETPVVMVSAPAASNWPARPGTAGTVCSTAAIATIPSGTGAQNTDCQPRIWVRVPPRNTPTRLPAPATAPHTPMARVRSAGVGNSSSTSVSAAGTARAAPMPWPIRPASSIGPLTARAETAEAVT